MKIFNNNHKRLMQYLKELRRLGRKDSKFSINDLINTNCLISFNEQFDRELIARRKENSVLRAWILVLDIEVPFWNIKKKRQYDRLSSYISSQYKELKMVVKIEDMRSKRLKKEYEKIEKGKIFWICPFDQQREFFFKNGKCIIPIIISFKQRDKVHQLKLSINQLFLFFLH